MRSWITQIANNVVANLIAAGVIALLLGLWAYVGKLPGPIVALIVLLSIGVVLFVFAGLRKLHPFKGGKAIAGQTIENRQVSLDGHRFTDCKFKNVTFRWDGGEGAIIRATIEGPRRFETQNGLIADTVDVLKALGFLDLQFAADWKRRDNL